MTQLSLSSAPFFFPGGEPGVLLIHGYLTAPDEMRPVGEVLAAAGATVLGIRLSGHGTTPADLEPVRWPEWVADGCAGLAELRRTCRRVSVAGLSLGGALSLYLAAHEPVERVVAFSAPDGALIRRFPVPWARPAARWLRFIPKIGADVHDPAARRAHTTYHQIPLRSVCQLLDFLQALDGALPQVTAPTLLVHARHDRVVLPATAPRIAARLGGPTKICWLSRGGHTVTLDEDRAAACEAARDWLMENGDVKRET